MKIDRVFRNVGIQNLDAGESPRGKHTIFRAKRKFEIKNTATLLEVFRQAIVRHH
jgi:hypothetical protein